MWQKCPICNGTGKNNEFDINTYNYTNICTVCNGDKIISSLSGLPPSGKLIKVDDTDKPQKVDDDYIMDMIFKING